MTEMDTVQSDLRFIKQAVQERKRGALPLGIALYWGLAGLIGFSLVDFAPERTGLFWLIAGPLGFVLSTWLGWRDAKVRGDVNEAEGHAIIWHWLAMMVAIFLCAMLVNSGELTGGGMGRATLLIVALAYFLGGLHFERSLMWIGAMLAVGFVVLGFVHAYVWTVLGVLLCLALLGAALAGRRTEPRHA